MLEQLIKLVQQNADDDIVKNPAIPNQYNEEAVKEVGNEIYNGMQDQTNRGNTQEVVSLFKTNNAAGLNSNPMIGSIITKIAHKFASKFGISPQVASQIAGGLVPKIMKQFINKTNDPNDRDFDLQDILKKFTGNSKLGDLMGQFSGENKSKHMGDDAGGFFDKKIN